MPDLTTAQARALVAWSVKWLPPEQRFEALADLMPALKLFSDEGFDEGCEVTADQVVERVEAGLLIPVEVLN